MTTPENTPASPEAQAPKPSFKPAAPQAPKPSFAAGSVAAPAPAARPATVAAARPAPTPIRVGAPTPAPAAARTHAVHRGAAAHKKAEGSESVFGILVDVASAAVAVAFAILLAFEL